MHWGKVAAAPDHEQPHSTSPSPFLSQNSRCGCLACSVPPGWRAPMRKSVVGRGGGGGGKGGDEALRKEELLHMTTCPTSPSHTLPNADLAHTVVGVNRVQDVGKMRRKLRRVLKIGAGELWLGPATAVAVAAAAAVLWRGGRAGRC